MIYILFVSLLVMLIISFFINKFDLLSPWLISISVFIISLLFVILNKDNWDISLSPYTVLIIIIAVLSIGIGETFARFVFRDTSPTLIPKAQNRMKIPRLINFFVYMFSVVVLIWYYLRMREIAGIVGYSSGQQLLIQYARLGILQYGISVGPVLAVATFLLRALSYVYTFIFLYNFYMFNKSRIKSEVYYLLPSIMYLVQYSLSGSRGAIIEYFTYVIILIGIFLIKTKKSNIETNKRIAKYAVLGLLVFFIVFIFLGNLKGWKGADVKSLLSIYTGGSILAFDNYLNLPKVPNEYFAEETLVGVNNLLSRIGIYEREFSRVLEFTVIDGKITTNIYTSIRRYIQDFGVFGMIIVQIIIGFFFGALYSKIKKSKRFNYVVIFYSILFMSVIYQSIDEQFLTTFLSTTQIFTVLFTYTFYRMLIRPKLRKEYLQYSNMTSKD
ncbi:hypothetical protein T472_0204605 [Youngiibacter fragilis 232.1]|uniref:Oligosaccharide repeat unit polymerase n=2 Tax=Youngiibacter TaxID=1408818 RepID=V7I7B6_9CLOT|nr:hypothetical protein T472_0204605 [Youngiibacter fragilis 232.1]